MNNNKAFTLIELLIVVAIIAILAAIAVPNFLEAQTRAKVSRAKADMRSLATGIETYHIDYNSFLYCNRPAFAIKSDKPGRPNHRPVFERLTSPVAYLSGVAAFTDPFKPKGMYTADWSAKTDYNAADAERAAVYNYYARNTTAGGQARWDEAESANGEPKPNWWFAVSAGPQGYNFHGDKINEAGLTKGAMSVAMFDATNGTVSQGSIWRAGGSPPSKTDRDFYDLIQGQY